MRDISSAILGMGHILARAVCTDAASLLARSMSETSPASYKSHSFDVQCLGVRGGANP